MTTDLNRPDYSPHPEEQVMLCEETPAEAADRPWDDSDEQLITLTHREAQSQNEIWQEPADPACISMVH